MSHLAVMLDVTGRRCRNWGGKCIAIDDTPCCILSSTWILVVLFIRYDAVNLSVKTIKPNLYQVIIMILMAS